MRRGRADPGARRGIGRGLARPLGAAWRRPARAAGPGP